MKLKDGELSITAYFPSSTRAEEATKELKTAGITEANIDRVSRYGVSIDEKINNPIAGQAETQTGLSIYSQDVDRFSNNDTRTLMGADPSVSGMASKGYGLAGGKSFMVTVLTDEKHLDRAVQILEKHHGYV
ncbi:hypothetical protein GGQ84_002415 [Desulfitispora alkaliphila]|uniref:hypothetical protein n=1 Tax=Desulfitispora alkaliphila TaxID=622674 RepID=UPI003D195B39